MNNICKLVWSPAGIPADDRVRGSGAGHPRITNNNGRCDTTVDAALNAGGAQLTRLVSRDTVDTQDKTVTLSTRSVSIAAGITSLTPSISGCGSISLNKVYDGRVTVPVGTAGVSFIGLLGGDRLSMEAIAMMGDELLVRNKPATLTDAVSRAHEGNCAVTLQDPGSVRDARGGIPVFVGSTTLLSGNTVGLDAAGCTTTPQASTTGDVATPTIGVKVCVSAAPSAVRDGGATAGERVTLTEVFSGADAGRHCVTAPPAWLNFDAGELRLSEAASAQEQPFDVVVICGDVKGHEARTPLTIQIKR